MKKAIFKDSKFIEESPYTSNQEINLIFIKNEYSNSSDAVAGIDFGRNVEPSGDYINLSNEMPKTPIETFTYGTINFKNPLFLEFKNTSSHGWKKDLSEMFDFKTGKKLNKAIEDAGFDGVITIDLYKGKYYFEESVNINGTKSIIKRDPELENKIKKSNKNKIKRSSF